MNLAPKWETVWGGLVCRDTPLQPWEQTASSLQTERCTNKPSECLVGSFHHLLAVPFIVGARHIGLRACRGTTARRSNPSRHRMTGIHQVIQAACLSPAAAPDKSCRGVAPPNQIQRHYISRAEQGLFNSIQIMCSIYLFSFIFYIIFWLQTK